MGNNGYVSFLSSGNGTGHVALFSASKGGETAGSIARTTSGNSAFGGETAGSIASSSCGSSSSCGGGSFTAIV